MPGIEKFALRGSEYGLRRRLDIGLVNNMPDAALRATEIQFARLLKSAATAIEVRLQLFSLPGIARSPETRARMEGFYASTDTLMGTRLDALIVTGCEPHAADLRDEPYWPQMAALVDWASRSTLSTLWSCLGAHAAVLHLDGIKRRPLPQKRSGVFLSERAQDDALFSRMRERHYTPHSRRNTLDEKALAGRGYRILSRSTDGDVDIFTRPGPSSFVFFQGHPEYDPVSLGREYCRDAQRFLRGETSDYPILPQGYFDAHSEAALHELAAAAQRDPKSVSAAHLSDLVSLSVPMHPWRASAVQLYANWLHTVVAQKARREATRKPANRAHLSAVR
jgi:homoserine O-succinyltransferase